MFSSFNFPYPSHFICNHRLVQGWKGTRNTKKEQRVGFGGLQRVKFKFVIPHVQVSIKMLQLVQHLVNKTGSGQSKSPCSLLNRKGLGNWQDSLLNEWCNTQTPLPVFFSLLLFTSFIYPLVEEEQLWESASLHQQPKQYLHSLSLLS